LRASRAPDVLFQNPGGDDHPWRHHAHLRFEHSQIPKLITRLKSSNKRRDNL